MIGPILLVAFYFIPMVIVYRYIYIAYGEDGVWSDMDFDMFYFWIMVIPVVNVAGIFALWFHESPYKDTKEHPSDKIAKFIGKTVFNIKKKKNDN